MSFLERIFGRDRRRDLDSLYRAIVSVGRDPAWYREGGVPDTIDGRFDMMAAIVALVLLRLEREGESCRQASVFLTEVFIEDMDASLRQIGIGEYIVGKHVGRLMGALGGRLKAFREAADPAAFEVAVRRNLFRDAPPSPQALHLVSGRLHSFARTIAERPVEELLAGRLPPP